MATAHNSTSTAKKSTYEQITDRIIAQLESGVAPWHKPWKTLNGIPTAPRNLISQKPYRGINALLTLISPYSSPFWLTYKQAQSIGGHVNAGEKSTPIVFWKFGEDEVEEPSGEMTTKTWAMCRLYHVFNVEQCTIPGLKLDSTPVADKSFNPIPECERILAAWSGKPEVRHSGDRAFYQPIEDFVNMPARESFDSPEFYYSVLFHEMTHSTGHRSRLGREGITEAHFWGDAVYSREELVAEMGAAFLSGHCGIEAKTLNNSAAYLQSWIRVLKADSRLAITAAAAAQKAADLILGQASKGEPASPPVSAPVAKRASVPVPVVKPVAPVVAAPDETSQVSLTVAKSNCPYVTLRTVHGAMVIDRRRYLAALRGVQVISATCSKPGDIRVLTVAHRTGTLKFYNQLDAAGYNTKRLLTDWARKEREKRAKVRESENWRSNAGSLEKFIGTRVTWVPRNEEMANRITGSVTALIVNPVNGKRGCVIADDWGRQHRVWDKQGTIYRCQDAPQLPVASDGSESVQAVA